MVNYDFESPSTFFSFSALLHIWKLHLFFLILGERALPKTHTSTGMYTCTHTHKLTSFALMKRSRQVLAQYQNLFWKSPKYKSPQEEIKPKLHRFTPSVTTHTKKGCHQTVSKWHLKRNHGFRQKPDMMHVPLVWKGLGFCLCIKTNHRCVTTSPHH